MISNSDVGDIFRNGGTRGQSNRMSISENKKSTFLVDYGWAVLAKRNKETGRMTYYSGWEGYSPTTSRHISQARLRSIENVSKKRPELGELL